MILPKLSNLTYFIIIPVILYKDTPWKCATDTAIDASEILIPLRMHSCQRPY